MNRPSARRLRALGRVLALVTLVVLAPLAAGGTGWEDPTPPDTLPGVAGTAEGQRGTGDLDDPHSSVRERGASAAGSREASRLRLLTGETVAVTERGGDVAYRPLGGATLRYVETSTGTYLLPESVDPSTYDRSLFDVRSLRERRLADGSAVPVLLETDAATDVLDRPGVRNVRELPPAGVVAAEVEPGRGTAAIEALVADGTVTSVSLDGAVELDADAELNAAGDLDGNDGTDPRQLRAPARAAAGTRSNLTGDGVTVAVLDTGIDSSHPALAGRVVDRVDLVDRNGTDPTLDGHGHGTHVAGVLAGGANADGEYAGVAPGASLVDVAVIGEDGSGRTSTVVEGLEYAVEEADADVVLMSLGSTVDGGEPLAEAVEWAADRGVVVVAAIGNNGYPRAVGAPGRPSGVITVGATGRDGRVASYSARGPTLDGRLKPELVAPGDRIVGPASASSGRHSIDRAGRYTRLSGTSAAAAQVAGAVALLLEVEPDLTAREVENRLASAARPVRGAGAYAQGGGRLAVDRALDPDVVAHDAVVDFGLVETDEQRTRTVTFENRDDRRHELSFEVSVRNDDADAPADGTAWLDRTAVSLAPGERETVTLTVDGANATPGAHSGLIRYAVDGAPRSVAFGFVRGGTVTVRKRPLTDGAPVDGDPLWVFTEERTHDEVLEFENGTATFVAGGGTYVLWSSGSDEPTGTHVLLSERRRFAGPERVVLDERATVPVGVNASPLVERYGPLANLSVVASMSAPAVAGAPKLSVSETAADGRAVRVSPDPGVDVATTFLLAPEGGRGTELDVPDVFHLVHGQRGVGGPSVVAADPERLVTVEHRYHRTTVDETYRVRDRANVDGVWNFRPHVWFDLGGRTSQRVHRLPAAATYSRTVDGGSWRAERMTRVAGEREGRAAGDRAVRVEGGAPTDVLSHPLLGLVERLTIDGGNVTVAAAPFADGAGTSVDRPGEHSLVIAVNGEVVHEGPVAGGAAAVDDVSIAPGDDISVRLVGNGSGGRLSTATRTEVGVVDYDPEAGIRPAVGNSPPIVRNVEVVGADAYNAVEPGEVTVSVDVDRVGALVDPTVWYAVGAPGDPPWENRSGWQRVSARRFGDGLRATFDVGEAAGTVSLAVEARTIRDHYARTMTANAFHVGEAPNASTSMLEGRLVTGNGTPAANVTVLVEPAAGGTTRALRTDGDGRFAAEVPRDRAYDLRYVNGEPWSPRASVGADRPAWLALGRVHVGDDVDLGNRTLPPGHPLEIRVVDQRGEPVEGATVRITHRSGAGNGTVAVTGRLRTTEDGWALVNRTDGPGVGLAGDLEVEVAAPDDALYPDQTHRFDVTLRGPEAYNLTLETAPPEATLTGWGQFRPGDLVSLSGRKSDVPAGVAEYRWDLDGDGTTDRITGSNNSTIRYDPAEWGREPALTVVDEAGKTDRSTVVVPLREPPAVAGAGD